MGMQQAGGMDTTALIQRIRRLAMLDTSVFDEVRGDAASTVPAVLVAVVSTLLFGLGGWLWWALNGPDSDFYLSSGDIFLKSFIIGSVLSVILWGVWVGITYIVLGQLFRARVDIQELVRVMGFATAPLALGVILFIPVLDFGIGLTSVALLFGATVIAVQSATDAPAGKTLVAVACGFAVWAIVLALFVGDDSIYAPGFFMFDVGAEILRA
ncbi:MAG: YIP1 family protein [Chloroflexi bacterium]|nr:YIP1 family protein [Chloroflexota bacterium]